MKLTNKPYFIVIILTFLATICVYAVYDIEPIKNEKLFKFPLKIGKWTGTKIPMEDWVFESLETPYSILRNYVSPDGKKINFTIVWYDDKEIAFHAAAACLGGAGNKVKEMAPFQVQIGSDLNFKIGRLITDKYKIRNLVFYFYVNDGYITPSQVDVREKIMFKRLRLKRSSAAFIRIMMPITKSIEDTHQKLEDFVRATLPFVIEYTDTEKVLSY